MRCMRMLPQEILFRSAGTFLFSVLIARLAPQDDHRPAIAQLKNSANQWAHSHRYKHPSKTCQYKDRWEITWGVQGTYNQQEPLCTVDMAIDAAESPAPQGTISLNNGTRGWSRSWGSQPPGRG